MLNVCLLSLCYVWSDQTPTPTRFLRNCEEVGLFNEIEQEFRQAQEEQNNKQVTHEKNYISHEISDI